MANVFETVIEHLRQDLAVLQVGRASPSVLDDVQVEAYDTKTPLSQLASVTSQGAQLLLIQPWDRTIIRDVERALRTCGRDYNPVVDGMIVRLPFPPLTEDKRKDIVKRVAEKAEAARVHVKRLRAEQMQTLKQQKGDKQLSEDAWFAAQKDVQKQVDHYNSLIDQLRSTKEADIMKL